METLNPETLLFRLVETLTRSLRKNIWRMTEEDTIHRMEVYADILAAQAKALGVGALHVNWVVTPDKKIETRVSILKGEPDEHV